MHGAEAVPGDRQTPSALGTMRRKVHVHLQTWRKGSKHRGHVYETMKTCSNSTTTKEDRSLALTGESSEAPEVELTAMPAT